jgi:hypothetical protein
MRECVATSYRLKPDVSRFVVSLHFVRHQAGVCPIRRRNDMNNYNTGIRDYRLYVSISFRLSREHLCTYIKMAACCKSDDDLNKCGVSSSLT